MSCPFWQTLRPLSFAVLVRHTQVHTHRQTDTAVAVVTNNHEKGYDPDKVRRREPLIVSGDWGGGASVLDQQHGSLNHDSEIRQILVQ